MNKLLKYSFVALCAGLMLTACKKEDKGPAATNLDASTITATPGEGIVTINWTVPEGANYQYIRITYLHPDTKKVHTRLASVHANSITIDGLLARHGAIDFTLVPVTKQGQEGTAHKITATANALPKRYQIDAATKTQVRFTAYQTAWTSTEQVDDGGGLPSLLDNNAGTFCHGRWAAPVPEMPHYFVLDLQTTDVRAISFMMQSRHNKGADAPKDFKVYGTNSFDATAFSSDYTSVLTHNNAVELNSYTGIAISANGATYDAAAFRFTDNLPYRYLIFQILSIHSGHKFPTLAELQIFKYQVQEFDPETGETIVLQ